MKNKKVVLYIIGAVAMVMALAGIAFFAGQLRKPTITPQSEVGIRNPDNIFAPEEKDQDVLEREENEKDEVSEDKLTEVDRAITRYLGEGRFHELDTYLMDIENKYRYTTDPTLVYQVDRIHLIRQDISRLSGITMENNKDMYKNFMSPEVLAAALVYEPVSEKYLANMNLAGVVIPGLEEGVNSFLTKVETTAEDEKILRDISSNHTDEYISTEHYRATVLGRTVDIILIQNGTTGLWRCYTVRVESGEQLMSTYQVNEIATMLEMQNASDQLDYIVIGEEYEPEHFAGDEGDVADRQSNADIPYEG